MTGMKYGNKTYSELISIPSFEERLEYLKLSGSVGVETFGSKRYLNQVLYRSREWKNIRRDIIIRDNGLDLAHPNFIITGKIMIHHIKPITEDDILLRRRCVFDPENLVCCSYDVHEIIHYGVEDVRAFLNDLTVIIRTPNDTSPWRK